MHDLAVLLLADAEPEHGLPVLINENANVLLAAVDNADKDQLRLFGRRGRRRRRRGGDRLGFGDRSRRRTSRRRKQRAFAGRMQAVERNGPERIAFAGWSRLRGGRGGPKPNRRRPPGS